MISYPPTEIRQRAVDDAQDERHNSWAVKVLRVLLTVGRFVSQRERE